MTIPVPSPSPNWSIFWTANLQMTCVVAGVVRAEHPSVVLVCDQTIRQSHDHTITHKPRTAPAINVMAVFTLTQNEPVSSDES